MIPLREADAAAIGAAVEALAAGRLLLHPTETLVSLSGDPYRAEAAEAAWRLKGYDEPRPFLCLVADPAAARALAAAWPPAAEKLAGAFWPGPLTLVVAATARAPGPVTESGRLAVRPASDPVSRALLAAWGRPLFSSSANRRGDPAPTRVADAARALEGRPGAEAVALGLLPPAGEGTSGGQPALPSSIVDVTGEPRLVRAGAISVERLRETLPEIGG